MLIVTILHLLACTPAPDTYEARYNEERCLCAAEDDNLAVSVDECIESGEEEASKNDYGDCDPDSEALRECWAMLRKDPCGDEGDAAWEVPECAPSVVYGCE